MKSLVLAVCGTCGGSGFLPFSGSGPTAFARAYLHDGAEPCPDCNPMELHERGADLHALYRAQRKHA